MTVFYTVKAVVAIIASIGRGIDHATTSSVCTLLPPSSILEHTIKLDRTLPLLPSFLHFGSPANGKKITIYTIRVLSACGRMTAYFRETRSIAAVAGWIRVPIPTWRGSYSQSQSVSQEGVESSLFTVHRKSDKFSLRGSIRTRIHICKCHQNYLPAATLCCCSCFSRLQFFFILCLLCPTLKCATVEMAEID